MPSFARRKLRLAGGLMPRHGCPERTPWTKLPVSSPNHSAFSGLAEATVHRLWERYGNSVGHRPECRV